MWIETQNGELVNIDTGMEIRIREPKIKNGGWWILMNNNVICAEYSEESNAQKAFEELKNKMRRTGAKIFKFKKESEENDDNGTAEKS